MKVAVILLCVFMAACATAPESKGNKSLFERMGGKVAIEAVVNDVVDMMAKDKVINENQGVANLFKTMDVPALKLKIVSQVCQATGGPCEYKGATMSDSHKKLNISEKEWKRMGRIFVKVLKKYKVPDAERKEFLKIVKSTKKDIVTKI